MRRILQILISLGLITNFISCGTSKSIHQQPQLTDYNQEIPIVEKHSDTLFSSGNNYLIKNKQQLWELYVSGDPLERGMLIGGLTQSLLQKQDRLFITRIKEIIPSKFRQKILRQFLKWYNRKLYLHIPEEYKTEIYGVSQYASSDYVFFESKYLQSLYLHGAHDIGHALQDLALVGCSSMAVWGDKSEDGSLLIGRNFDFYAGDEFAEDKIIAFITPDKGHPFMMVTWGGMVGAVSGMNKEGLTVTINAGKSKIPVEAKTPISILSREILQYAATIDEAIAIAKKRQVFVSESIMVGSARDKKAILIEVSPDNFGIYETQNNSQLVCTNHFQSEAYQFDKRNEIQIKESHSKYRMDRMQELLAGKEKMTPENMAQILRDREGLQDLKMGYGNEKALNHLLAHHSIIFKPEQRMVWVSSNPYQLGEFVAYDLNKIFSKNAVNFVVSGTDKLNIPKDHFLKTEAYENFEKYRILDKIVDKKINENGKIEFGFVKEYQSLNPDLWSVYYKIGKYYYQKGWYKAAELEFKKATTKEITTLPDKHRIDDYLKKVKRKIK